MGINQIEKPKAGDPFFNNGAAGGLSTCITCGEPGLNVLPNCVGGAVGCYNKMASGSKAEFKYLNYPPNAENILARAEHDRLPIAQKPEVGCLIVWQKGATLSSTDGAGHVAYVNAVDADGTIHTSESEYRGRAWVNRTYKPPYNYAAGYKFLGFILQPTEGGRAKYIRKDDSGDDVLWLQRELAKRGYLRRTEIDGEFGKITLGGVCAFQLETGLEVDGVAGPATQKALEGGRV